MSFFDEFQIYYFLYGVFGGVLCGALYEIPVGITSAIKNRIITAIVDVVWMCASAFLCMYLFYMLDFPNIRLYMIVSVFVGMVIYYETLHIIIAFFIKLVYNIIKTKFKQVCNIIKTKRRKVHEQSAER